MPPPPLFLAKGGSLSGCRRVPTRTTHNTKAAQARVSEVNSKGIFACRFESTERIDYPPSSKAHPVLCTPAPFKGKGHLMLHPSPMSKHGPHLERCSLHRRTVFTGMIKRASPIPVQGSKVHSAPYQSLTPAHPQPTHMGPWARHSEFRGIIFPCHANLGRAWRLSKMR